MTKLQHIVQIQMSCVRRLFECQHLAVTQRLDAFTVQSVTFGLSVECTTAGKMSSTIQPSTSNDLGQQLKSLKVQPDAQPAKGRALQSLLNQSFQPATPDQPQLDHALLHTVSTTSNYSSSSGQQPYADSTEYTEDGVKPLTVSDSADHSSAPTDASGPARQLSGETAPDAVLQSEQDTHPDLSRCVKVLPEHDALVAVAAENRAAQLPQGQSYACISISRHLH